MQGAGAEGACREAREVNRRLSSAERESDFAGFGGTWGAMRAVLAAKFAAGSALAAQLVATGDAFLLQHCPASAVSDAGGEAHMWSNNFDGEGDARLAIATRRMPCVLLLLRLLFVWAHPLALPDFHRQAGAGGGREEGVKRSRTVHCSLGELAYTELCNAGGAGMLPSCHVRGSVAVRWAHAD